VLSRLLPSAMASPDRVDCSTVPYMKSKSVTTILVACWNEKWSGASVASPYGTV
jgi:hypothetical protein